MIERRFNSTNAGAIESSQVGAELRSDAGQEQREQPASPKIVGYTAVFGVRTTIPSMFGEFEEVIDKGAFRRAIREKQDVRALRNHDADNLLGRTTSKTLRIEEDDIGLKIEVDPPDTTIGRDTVESIRRGDLSGMSFAFVVRAEKWINGEDGQPDLRIIKDVDLYDVGPVTYPAYEQTSADLREATEIHKEGLRQLGKELPMEDEQEEAEELRVDEQEVEELIQEIAEDLEESRAEEEIVDAAERGRLLAYLTLLRNDKVKMCLN